MEPTRCIASRTMSHLLAWRNPQGKENNWWMDNQGQRIDNYFKHTGKVICTEIGLLGLATIAAVETVVYSVLTIASLALYPVTSRPCKFFAKLLGSSSFTVIWSIVNAAFSNLRYINIYTSESLARLEASRILPFILRNEDRDYIQEIRNEINAARHIPQQVDEHIQQIEEQMHRILQQNLAARRLQEQEFLRNIQQHVPRVEPEQLPNRIQPAVELQPIRPIDGNMVIIEAGARFLLDDVLANASQETRDAFEEVDVDLCSFIMTKAVYIYAVGDRRAEPLPSFFKVETQNRITELRRTLNNQAIIRQLGACMENPAQFNATIADQTVREALNSLKGIGSEEGQGGQLSTRCWLRAIEMEQEKQLRT